MNITGTLTGFTELMGGLDFVKGHVGPMMDRALEKAATKVFERSQELVPVDTGNLKGSGSMQKTGDHEFEVGYSADYALAVHEVFASHAAPTTWKYLEIASIEVEDDMNSFIGDLDITNGLGYRVS